MSTGTEPEESSARMPGRRGPANVVHGDNHGIVSSGNYTFNVQYTGNGLVETPGVMQLPLQDPPPLPPAGPRRLHGRDALVRQTADRLLAGHSVQLYGHESTGRRAVAGAVHRILAEQGVHGHVLETAGDDAQELTDRLARLFTGENLLRAVDPAQLRARVASVTAHLTLVDCELTGEDLTRLTEVFGRCTFLLTSRYASLPDNGGVHHVPPLPKEDAVALLADELGVAEERLGLRELQFDHVYRMSLGQPRRLLLYARFLKDSEAFPSLSAGEPFDTAPPVDPGRLTPERQAAALAVPLEEPFRQVLLALAAFGAPLTAPWAGALAGTGEGQEALRELRGRRLVTSEGEAVRITEDARAAVRDQGWEPADPRTAAEGVLALLAGGGPPPLPDASLLPALARRLNNASQWATSARLVAAAAPFCLRSGYRREALLLYTLGGRAATQGGLTEEAEYFVHTEKHTRNLLEGDRVAATAALAALATLSVPAGAGAVKGGGGVAGFLAKLSTAKTAVVAGAGAAAVGGATVVAVAVSGAPAGCDEAQEALASYQQATAGSPSAGEIAGHNREFASRLESAAAGADPEIATALRTQSDELEKEADAKEQDEADQATMHPDVRKALNNSSVVRMRLGTVRVLYPHCPDVMEK